MVKMNVEFQTPEQLVEFSSMCQRTEADTLIEDVAHKLIIDGKSVMGMMTVTLGKKMILVIEGENEEEILHSFEKYQAKETVQKQNLGRLQERFFRHTLERGTYLEESIFRHALEIAFFPDMWYR